MLSLYKKIIGIDSSPSAGNVEVALFCEGLCKTAGFQVDLQEGLINGIKQLNLFARSPKSSRKNEIIFQTHLDTVEPGPLGNWTKTDNNPYLATVEDENIYGLGTADVKLDFLCKLRALKEFVQTPMKNPFVLVGTFGEEVGMQGCQRLLEKKYVNAKMAIIGEPSELQIVHANNGYLVVRFEIPFSKEETLYRKEHDDKNLSTQEKVFHGKAVHSSTPHLGENALHKLVDYLLKMPAGIAVHTARGGTTVNTVPAEAHVEVDANKNFRKSVGDKLVSIIKDLRALDREFLNFENKLFSPSHPTLNIGVLNTTDSGLVLEISLRITPQVTEEQVNQWIDRMKGFAETNNSECVPERFSPAAFTPLESPLVQGSIAIARSLNLPEKPITKASGTEMSVYCKYGIDCLVFGPGKSIGNSHTANEHNILSHLESATRFYTGAVERFCQ